MRQERGGREMKTDGGGSRPRGEREEWKREIREGRIEEKTK